MKPYKLNNRLVEVKQIEYDGSIVEVLEAVYLDNNNGLNNEECEMLAKEYGTQLTYNFYYEVV